MVQHNGVHRDASELQAYGSTIRIADVSRVDGKFQVDFQSRFPVPEAYLEVSGGNMNCYGAGHLNTANLGQQKWRHDLGPD